MVAGERRRSPDKLTRSRLSAADVVERDGEIGGGITRQIEAQGRTVAIVANCPLRGSNGARQERHK